MISSTTKSTKTVNTSINKLQSETSEGIDSTANNVSTTVEGTTDIGGSEIIDNDIQ